MLQARTEQQTYSIQTDLINYSYSHMTSKWDQFEKKGITT